MITPVPNGFSQSNIKVPKKSLSAVDC